MLSFNAFNRIQGKRIILRDLERSLQGEIVLSIRISKTFRTFPMECVAHY